MKKGRQDRIAETLTTAWQYQPTAKQIPNRNHYRCKGLGQALSYIHMPNNRHCLCVSVPV